MVRRTRVINGIPIVDNGTSGSVVTTSVPPTGGSADVNTIPNPNPLDPITGTLQLSGSNLGFGSGLYAGANGSNHERFEFRSIVAGAGVDIDTDATTITITNTASKHSPGVVVPYPAGHHVGGHRVVMATSGSIYHSDNEQINNAQLVLGITLGAANPGDTVMVQVLGEIEEPSWNWDLQLPIYLGQNGVLSQTVPTAPAKFCLIVGQPITPTKMFINIRTPIALF